MTSAYHKKRNLILGSIASRPVYNDDADVTPKQRLEAVHIRHLIGYQFLTELPKLIRSSWGEAIVSIPDQIQAEVERGVALGHKKLFGGDQRLSEHAYYVVGFLNHAGLKESKRRSKKKDVGACIEKACNNFLAADSPDLAELRQNLHTRLVDR